MRNILFVLAFASGCATVHKAPNGVVTYSAREGPAHLVHQDTVSTVDDVLAARSQNPNAPMSVRVQTSNNRGTTTVDMSTGWGVGMLGGGFGLPGLDPCARIDPVTGVGVCAIMSSAASRQPGVQQPLPVLQPGSAPAPQADIERLEAELRALQTYVGSQR